MWLVLTLLWRELGPWEFIAFSLVFFNDMSFLGLLHNQKSLN